MTDVRKFIVGLQLPRALFHMLLIGVWAVCDLAWAHRWVVWITLFAVLLWEMLRGIVPSMNRLPALGYILRKSEGKDSTPASLFLIAVLLITSYCSREVVAVAIFVTAFSDPASRVVGMMLGKRRILGSRKTWVGSSGGFIVAFAVAFFLQYSVQHHALGGVVLASLAAAVAAVVAEVVIPIFAPTLLDDNFWIPFLCALAVHATRYALAFPAPA